MPSNDGTNSKFTTVEMSSNDPVDMLRELCTHYAVPEILIKSLFDLNTRNRSDGSLTRSNDREFILNLEAEIIEFIMKPNVDSWKLTPLNSYYRLLTHKLAEYYNLGHILSNDGYSMVLFKINTSLINADDETKKKAKFDQEGNIRPLDFRNLKFDPKEKLNRVKLAELYRNYKDRFHCIDVPIMTPIPAAAGALPEVFKGLAITTPGKKPARDNADTSSNKHNRKQGDDESRKSAHSPPRGSQGAGFYSPYMYGYQFVPHDQQQDDGDEPLAPPLAAASPKGRPVSAPPTPSMYPYYYYPMPVSPALDGKSSNKFVNGNAKDGDDDFQFQYYYPPFVPGQMMPAIGGYYYGMHGRFRGGKHRPYGRNRGRGKKKKEYSEGISDPSSEPSESNGVFDTSRSPKSTESETVELSEVTDSLKTQPAVLPRQADSAGESTAESADSVTTAVTNGDA